MVSSSVTFKGRQYTRQDVLSAMALFDREYPDTNQFDRWLEKHSFKYAVEHGDRLYPPKYLLHLMSGESRATFSGGASAGCANSYFERLGFEVIRKPGAER